MQQAGEVVRTSVDRYSDAFVKFIQSAFDNQDGKINHNSYATKFRLIGTNLKCLFHTQFCSAEFLDGAVDMTEPQVKQKIATFTETAVHDKAVTADRY